MKKKLIIEKIRKEWKVIETALLSVPFIWLLVGALLQSHSCDDPNLFSGQDIFSLCNGTHVPDFIKDGIYYDLVFLRGGSNPNESHWISTIMVCLMYFVSLAIVKQGRFAFIFTVWFGEFHETFWSVFEYAYNRVSVYGGEHLVLFWIFAPSILLVLGLMIYSKFFFQWGMLAVVGIWIGYLEAWWIFAGLHVTVLLKGLSPYYYSVSVNLWENGGWEIVTATALLYLLKYKRQIRLDFKMRSQG